MYDLHRGVLSPWNSYQRAKLVVGPIGSEVGWSEGVARVRSEVGEDVKDGSEEGFWVETTEGSYVGSAVGASVGSLVGATVGIYDGAMVGFLVGLNDG